MKIEESLKMCRVFSELNQADVQKIAVMTELKEYEAGAAVFQKGEPARKFLVLQEGKVALQRTLPATQSGVQRSITIDIVSTNEVIGWSALVEPHVHDLSTLCLQQARVLHIDGIELKKLMLHEPKIGYGVMKELIKVIASRLEETTYVLASERLVAMPAAAGAF
ncbi:MAG: Crp/Fnr family transcriptional regulator [Chloroflexi bacterium]|nr:Crp/Fnr family transcriptional regulator [Chloroflexota bacterium]